MKNFTDLKGKRERRNVLLTNLLFAILVSLCLYFGVSYIGNMGNEQGIKLTREAVLRNVVECYSIEGIYPPNVKYIEDNYNFTYDKTKYYIHYDAFASNIMPTIEVYEKR